MFPDSCVTYVPDCSKPTSLRLHRSFHVFKIIVTLALAAAIALPAEAVAQAQTPARQREEIVAFVRGYVDAANRVDIDAAMQMTSRNPNVSSATLGSITRGWDALRAQADEAAGSGGMYQVALGSLDVTPLNQAALVVSTVTLNVTTPDGTVQLRGAMTLVLERVAGAWKVLHEHVSLPLPE